MINLASLKLHRALLVVSSVLCASCIATADETSEFQLRPTPQRLKLLPIQQAQRPADSSIHRTPVSQVPAVDPTNQTAPSPAALPKPVQNTWVPRGSMVRNHTAVASRFTPWSASSRNTSNATKEVQSDLASGTPRGLSVADNANGPFGNRGGQVDSPNPPASLPIRNDLPSTSADLDHGNAVPFYPKTGNADGFRDRLQLSVEDNVETSDRPLEVRTPRVLSTPTRTADDGSESPAGGDDEPLPFNPPMQLSSNEPDSASDIGDADVLGDLELGEEMDIESADSDIPSIENGAGDEGDDISVEHLREALRAFPGRHGSAEESIEQPQADAENATEGAVVEPDSSRAKKDQETDREPLELTADVAALRPQVAQVLRYYYARPENVAKRSPWGTFHLMLPFGGDANVIAGRKKYNTVAWLCGNGSCRGQNLMTTTRSGRIYVRQGVGLQGHQAQFLAMLAQVNVSSEYPLTVARRRFTVEDLIRAEMADCRSGQELTFTLIGLSHYLPTDSQWTASDGKKWNFEKLIAEELAQPIVGAACGGTHRLMGFSYALRQRRLEGLPITGQWKRAELFIEDFVEYAWSLQNADGSFSTEWFEGRADNRDIDRKIQTTGHILEWLIFTADRRELQDERFVRGMQFLSDSFTRYRTRNWEPGPKGHVLRALSLYHRRVYGEARPWVEQTARASSGQSTASYR